MANGKKSKKKLIIFGSIGVVLLAIVMLVIFKGQKEEIIEVQVEKAAVRTITSTVTANGKIQSEFAVVITPEVTGELVILPIKDGQKVKKGDLLARIKPDRYIAQYEGNEASLKQAQASMIKSQSQLTKVTADYNRISELHKKKLASDQEMESIRSQYQTAQADYDQSKAYVQQAEAQLRTTREDLNKTTINAPMDGTITTLNVELGERVLGSGFSQGTNLMTVSDLSSIEAIVEVDENDIVNISIGDTAKVKIDAFGDKEFLGTVSEIGNSAITEGLGTQNEVVNFQVKVKLIQLDDAIRPGMSCTATIQTETKQNVVSVPIQSITARVPEKKMEEGEENEMRVVNQQAEQQKASLEIQEIVFVLDGNKVKSVTVKTGISDDNYIEVVSGLKGDEEIVSGSYKAISKDLNNGSLVSVQGREKPAK